MLGTALNLLLLPLQKLMEGIGWILEKLGLIPGGLDAASKKAAAMKDPVVWEWDKAQGKMVKKEWNWSPASEGGQKHTPPALSAVPPALTTPETGTMRRLDKIASNTGGLLEEEKKKKIGPGDIVFKNLPRALAVRGEWKESHIAQSTLTRPAPDIPTVKAAPAQAPFVKTQPATVPADTAGFNGEIHVHLHGVNSSDPREMARMVGDAVKAELNRLSQTTRGNYRDRE